MESHWLYKGKNISDAPEGAFGFIYKITNLETNRYYIGRKYLSSTRRKALTAKQKREGKKRRTKVTSDSNWRTYVGSNDILQKDIKDLGKDNFKFEILIFGESKGQVNYLEMKLQFMLDASIDPKYYNDCIGAGKFITMKDPEILMENIKNHL